MSKMISLILLSLILHVFGQNPPNQQIEFNRIIRKSTNYDFFFTTPICKSVAEYYVFQTERKSSESRRIKALFSELKQRDKITLPLPDRPTAVVMIFNKDIILASGTFHMVNSIFVLEKINGSFYYFDMTESLISYLYEKYSKEQMKRDDLMCFEMISTSIVE